MPQTEEEKKAAEAQAAAEDITIKKADLEKIKLESENYQKMGNKYKDDAERWQSYQKTEAEKAEADKQKQNQNNNQGSGQFDELKVTEIARKTLRDTNQKTAQNNFFKNFSEEDKIAVLSELHLSGNETSVDELTDRLEAANLEYKRKTGKLDEYIEQQKERARAQGRAEGYMDMGHQGGGAGDKNGGGNAPALSEKGKEMAQRMHVDPQKAAKVDPKKDNVIQI